jgi:hypothetical protein
MPLDEALQLMDSQTLEATGDSETVLDLGEGFAPAPDLAGRVQIQTEALEVAEANSYQVEVQESADGQTFAPTGLVLQIAETASITASAWLNRV